MESIRSLACRGMLGLLTVIISPLLWAQQSDPFVRFGVNDGLDMNETDMIIQDGQGFIWSRQATGLSKFDGYKFKTYKLNPDDSLSQISQGILGALMVDEAGDIWLNNFSDDYHSREILKYDRQRDGFLKFKPDVKGYISHLCHDQKQSIIWLSGLFGMGLYEYNIQTKNTVNYQNPHPDSLVRNRRNHISYVEDLDSILILYSGDGLWKFNKTTKVFSRPKLHPRDTATLFSRPLTKLGRSPWILSFPDAYVYRISPDFSIQQSVKFPDHLWGIAGRFAVDSKGIFWFATLEGLYSFDPKSKATRLYRDPSVTDQFLWDVSIDQNDNVWVCSQLGIKMLKKQDVTIKKIRAPGSHTFAPISINDSGYTAFLGLSVPINDTRLFTGTVTLDTVIIEPFEFVGAHDKPSNLMSGVKGRTHLWIATWGRGVLGIPIDPATGKLTPKNIIFLEHDPDNPNTISTNNTWCVYEDGNEFLWVGSFAGICRIDRTKKYGTEGSVQLFTHDPNNEKSLAQPIVREIIREDEDSFWVQTDIGVDFFKDGDFTHVFKDREGPMGIRKVGDTALYIGTSGGIYVGYKRDHYKTFTKFITSALWVDAVINGQIWCSSASGIQVYDNEKHVKINLFDDEVLPQGSRMALTREGVGILFGTRGSHLGTFDPGTLKISDLKALPVITSLEVNNKNSVVSGHPATDNDFIIQTNPNVFDEVTLDYQHNDFAFEFAAMDLTSPKRNLYKHKLEGYDPDWIETDWQNRKAHYTNLNPGTYTFRVKASNYHGIWSDNERAVKVIILPPPWRTWWAYSFYGVMLIGMLVFARSYEVKRLKFKHRAEHLSELDSLKTRFFANISHEFRTPITLILGPLKDLYQKSSDQETKTVVGPVIRNGQRLLRLINQLLDLSKLEAGGMTLQVTQADLVQLLRDIASSYESLAADKRIKFTVHSDVRQLNMFLDPDKIEKVIHNILSNAFKFTNENGEVHLSLKQENDRAVVSIMDTGIGIPDQQVDKIFDRFYQVDSSQTRGYEGTGIGMALAKELVELHYGTISVESIEGMGSTFTVKLPLSQKYSNQELTFSPESKGNEMLSELVPETNGIETGKGIEVASESLPVLLVVEDNADMRNYIRKTLKENYQVEEAVNGKEGVKKAKDVVPDLIISDVMMPEMDGYHLCELIKTDEVTSHIPVILLTAKADQQSRLTGLENRADDYLIKPFDSDELKLIVRNHILQQQKMRERFSREIMLEPAQISISSHDEKFLQKVLALIEEHMEDENFSIEDFSREAGYSRMQLYRKLKALAGQTPSQFVRTIRLKRAAQLLVKKSDNVAQIAYSVGFGNLAYFNKCFKDQYGVTPGQFDQGGHSADIS